MRTGAYTIHQSLTAEAAAVLKLSLSLARRRGHAQVTPLHVAFTLLSSSCSSPLFTFSSSAAAAAGGRHSYTYSLLKRACLKSHPAHSPASHPLQCRALELCFNVALNRLPTTAAATPHSSPSSSTTTSTSSTSFSSSLIQPNPTLSNALIAALKRAQANQRRGCIELQQQTQQPPPPQTSSQQQQQQQPLLAIKVELDQLIISILDDPSVSRVMREAGFSSTTVKSNLEEESALLLGHNSSSPAAMQPQFFFESHREIPIHARSSGGGGGGFWPAQLLHPPGISSCSEDVKAVLEVMVRKQGRKTNPVVVGDSVSMAEAAVDGLMRRLERGEVPEDLRGAHLLKLQLSYVPLRLMSKADVEMKVAELRRSVDAVAGSSLVVYVGDLRWAIDEEPAAREDGVFSPVEHMVAELARLVGELRAAARARVWLVATASYQTYMKCQRKKPSLEALWALQPVVVPTGSGTGLALGLHASAAASPSAAEARISKLAQSPFQLFEPMGFPSKGDEEKLVLCTECSRNYERESSVLKAEAEGTKTFLTQFTGWLQPEKPEIGPKDNLVELKRKWSRLCQRLHFHSNLTYQHSAPFFGSGLTGKSFTYSSSQPWWSTSLPNTQSKLLIEPHTVCHPETSSKSNGGFLNFESLEHGKNKRQWSPPEVSLSPPRNPACLQDTKTNLALGSLLLSDSATSEASNELELELERRLQRNVPWQSGAIDAIVDAVVGRRKNEKKGVWLFLQGSDSVAMRRVALVIAETHCGWTDKLICVDPKKSEIGELCPELIVETLKKDQKLVLLIENIDQAAPGLLDCLVHASENGFCKHPFHPQLDLSDSIIILTASDPVESSGRNAGESPNNVINLVLSFEEAFSGDLKRKTEAELPRDPKRARNVGVNGLDLNVRAEEDCDHGDKEEEEEGIPSDITHECDSGELDHPWRRLLKSIATRITLTGSHHQAANIIRAKLVRSFAECRGGELDIDDEAVVALMAASGYFLDEVFERWVREVFETAVATVEKGGKVRLGLGSGGVGRGSVVQSGFMGSVLPNRIHVD